MSLGTTFKSVRWFNVTNWFGGLFHAVGPATEKALEFIRVSCTWYVIQSQSSWTHPFNSATGVTMSKLCSGAVHPGTCYDGVHDDTECIIDRYVQSEFNVVHAEHHWSGHVVQVQLRNAPYNSWLDVAELTLQKKRIRQQKSILSTILTLELDVVESRDQPHVTQMTQPS